MRVCDIADHPAHKLHKLLRQPCPREKAPESWFCLEASGQIAGQPSREKELRLPSGQIPSEMLDAKNDSSRQSAYQRLCIRRIASLRAAGHQSENRGG